jgi:arylsulfatase A-like enzyme
MPPEERTRPNIVVILADDVGFSDLGCFGGEVRTPNLDRLAQGGLQFTQMYNYARCCPSRAALLTGLYPHQTGVGHMTRNMGIPSYQGYLNDNCVTIAETLKAEGYRTILSGKWHVAGGNGETAPHPRPRRRIRDPRRAGGWARCSSRASTRLHPA